MILIIPLKIKKKNWLITKAIYKFVSIMINYALFRQELIIFKGKSIVVCLQLVGMEISQKLGA